MTISPYWKLTAVTQKSKSPAVVVAVTWKPTCGVLGAPVSFVPDASLATEQERKTGLLKRTLSVALLFRDGRKTVRRMIAADLTVRLNLEKVVRRVPPALGSILGMTPKGLR